MRRLWKLLSVAQQTFGASARGDSKRHLLVPCPYLGAPEAGGSWRFTTSLLGQRSGSWAQSQGCDAASRAVATLSEQVDGTGLSNRSQHQRDTTAGLPRALSVPAGDAASTVKSIAHGSASSVMPEAMLRLLLQPVPLPRQRNKVLNDRLVLCGGAAFLDPTTTLHSMMRALYVVKQVLRANGQVYIVNGNPLTAPLLREAANCCMNGNVWFRSGRWPLDTLNSSTKLFKRSHQPNAELFSARNLRMGNVLATGGTGAAADHAKMPKLGSQDKWRLWSLGRPGKDAGASAHALLGQIVKQETSTSRLPLPGSPRGHSGSLVRLIVALSPTHDAGALEDAFKHGVPTISLVNMHSPLDRITYPVYASDTHVRFQHLFMDWLLKVVNLPPDAPAGRQLR